MDLVLEWHYLVAVLAPAPTSAHGGSWLPPESATRYLELHVDVSLGRTQAPAGPHPPARGLWLAD